MRESTVRKFRNETDFFFFLSLFFGCNLSCKLIYHIDGPICFVPELVAGSAAISMTYAQPQILFTADSLHSASHSCNAILPTCIRNSCIFADILCIDSIIRTH